MNFDRFLVCAAYYYVASRYHSGQWSKGYVILSRVVRIPYRPGVRTMQDPEVRAHAAALLRKRRREIRREW